ncbi:putative mating locus protein [Aspergillus alliaceus]|uniref:putative mating locus protein n=1 Tax=Petromyces alliaceus TaxID=209559 RepID=UPI0012A6957D|nr:uncharacterized protein BDW43DRAFT_266037 [Aspergillus alliaceus]KAB8236786.1 hypothetical protein BDW43DRAFT_266037 [Aspergillus alliaceus]
MEMWPCLNDAENGAPMQATDCEREDAYKFWNWSDKNRISYSAMKACILLLETLEYTASL